MDPSEVSFIINWSAWIPVIIAVVSLGLTVYQMNKRSKGTALITLEAKVDRAQVLIDRLKDDLKNCGREKDELRRERMVLLETIAEIRIEQRREDD